jgi:hypothetical protein
MGHASNFNVPRVRKASGYFADSARLSDLVFQVREWKSRRLWVLGKRTSIRSGLRSAAANV